MNDYIITNEEFVEVYTTPEMKKIAFENAEEYIEALKKDKASMEHMKRTSVVEMKDKINAIRAGAIAEQACKCVFPQLKEVHKTSKNKDYLYGNATWESKSLRCKFKPHLDYEMSILESSMHQQCDWYALARVLNDFKTTWIVGFMLKEEFIRKGWFTYKGDIRKSDGFVYKDDCNNIYIDRITYRPFTKKKVDEVLGLDSPSNAFFGRQYD